MRYFYYALIFSFLLIGCEISPNHIVTTEQENLVIRPNLNSPIITGPQNGVNDVSTGLMAHYSFNDMSLTDLSGNGFDGILFNEPKSTEGKHRIPNSALYFEDQYPSAVELPTHPFNQPMNDWTLYMRVKIQENSETNPAVLGYLFQCGTNFQESPAIRVQVDKIYGNSEDEVNVGFALGKPGLETNMSFGTVKVGEWHDLSITFTGRYFTIYNNGEIFYAGELGLDENLTPMAFSSPCTIGYGINGMFENLAGPITGSIDEFRIYNRALTEKQIKYLTRI